MSVADPDRALEDFIAALALRRTDRVIKSVKRRVLAGEEINGQTSDAGKLARKRLMDLTAIQGKLKRARETRGVEHLWPIIPQIIQVEQEIHGKS